MSKNAILLISVGIVVAAMALFYFFGWSWLSTKLKYDTAAQDARLAEHKYDPGEQLNKQNPRYGRAIDFASSGNIEAAVSELTALQAEYAPGSTERNVIDFTIAQLYMFQPDASQAVDRFKIIASSEDGTYNSVTRALAVEGLLRVASNFKQEDISRIFKGDSFFEKFHQDAGGDYTKALYALALKGYALSNTPITAARLAQKVSIDVRAGTYKTPEEKKQLIGSYNNYLEAGEREILKVTDLPHYNAYRSEYYSIRASALANMFLAKEGATTKAEIVRLFEEAYTLGWDSAKPYIAFKYAAFLVDAGDATDAQTIDALVAKVGSIPAERRVGFNAYIKNALALGPAGGAGYSMIVNLRKANKSFDAYVANVLAR